MCMRSQQDEFMWQCGRHQLIEKREVRMPEKKHVRGVGDKEQRQYEHIKESAKKSGRYGERAEEVAARTVLKQHKKEGHQKGH